uniref:Component of conjugal plasmid transfer system n=1 Tax=Vibrio sp. FF_291 TaxID=1652832 RepID=A0A0H3ZVS7_9VIBR|nr:Component of conjugal plasmid transfer system [Vibrio sp. FF_291]
MKKFIIALYFISFFSLAADGGLVPNMLPKKGSTSDGFPVQELEQEQIDEGEPLPSPVLERTDVPMKVTSLNAQQETFDTSSATANTLIIPYNPTATYKLAVREVMGTTIVLPEGEGIVSYRLGDESYWSFDPEGTNTDAILPRIGSVQVYMPGSDTSLTIVGSSGNIYTFYLRGYTWKAKVDPTLTVYINDDRLQTKLEAAKRRQLALEKAERDRSAQIEEEKRQRRLAREKNDYLKEAAVTPEDYDFGYKIEGGDEDLAPYYVYDDGIFTYFKFDDKSQRMSGRPLPVVYKVLDGSDSPTNASVIGETLRTLRVEGVNNSWTLRLGEKYLCVKRRIPIPSPASNMNSIVEEASVQ